MGVMYYNLLHSSIESTMIEWPHHTRLLTLLENSRVKSNGHSIIISNHARETATFKCQERVKSAAGRKGAGQHYSACSQFPISIKAEQSGQALWTTAATLMAQNPHAEHQLNQPHQYCVLPL